MPIVMFYLNWRYVDRAVGCSQCLSPWCIPIRAASKASRSEVTSKEGEIVSVIQEVLTSIRVVKAFAREDYEQRRLEEESLESVEIALRARGLKAKLSPFPSDPIVAVEAPAWCCGLALTWS